MFGVLFSKWTVWDMSTNEANVKLVVVGGQERINEKNMEENWYGESKGR